jgi:hypothetical protein
MDEMKIGFQMFVNGIFHDFMPYSIVCIRLKEFYSRSNSSSSSIISKS